MEYNNTFESEIQDSVLINYQFITKFILYNAPLEKIEITKAGLVIEYVTKYVSGAKDCGQVHPKYFNTSISQFSESFLYNSCLYRKIGIDIDGNIKNCPSCSLHYGSIYDNVLDIKQLISSKPFMKLGMIKKESVKVCKDCEFRYMCSDCRVYTINNELYEKPLNCKYDPYTGTWE